MNVNTAVKQMARPTPWHGTKQQEERIVCAERVLNEYVEQRRYHHEDAAHGVAAFAADAIDHFRHPGATNRRSQGKYAHDHADITLVASAVKNVERQ